MRTPPHAILILGAAMLWAAHAKAAGPLTRPGAPEAKLAYEQARELAAANYKNARAQCDAVTGNPKDVCVAEAKAARVRTEEEARAKYEDTLKAYTRARLRIADANYSRDKARCAGLAGAPQEGSAEQQDHMRCTHSFSPFFHHSGNVLLCRKEEFCSVPNTVK